MFKVNARFAHFGVNFFLLSEEKGVGFWQRTVAFTTKHSDFSDFFGVSEKGGGLEREEAFRIGTWLRLFMAPSLEKSAVKVFSPSPAKTCFAKRV